MTTADMQRGLYTRLYVETMYIIDMTAYNAHTCRSDYLV